MSRNTPTPSVKTMDENWKITFGEVLQERKNKLKIWKILTILALSLFALAYSGMVGRTRPDAQG